MLRRHLQLSAHAPSLPCTLNPRPSGFRALLAFTHFWVYTQCALSVNSRPKRQAGWLFWQGTWSTVVLKCFVNDHRCWYITIWQRNSGLYWLLAFRWVCLWSFAFVLPWSSWAPCLSTDCELCASTLWQDCPGPRPPLPWSSSCFCTPACGLNVFCLSDLFTFCLWPLPLCNLDYNKDNRLITHISSSKSELDDASRPIPGWSCHVFCIIYHFLVQRHPTNVEMNCLNLLKTINKLREGYSFRCQ